MVAALAKELWRDFRLAHREFDAEEGAGEAKSRFRGVVEETAIVTELLKAASAAIVPSREDSWGRSFVVFVLK